MKLTSTYSMADFRADLSTLYSRAGLRGEGLVFLLTDQQVVHERMLVYFNDMLSSGSLPDLYTSEDKDNVVNAIRNEVKAAGVMDSSENCWGFFIDKVRVRVTVRVTVTVRVRVKVRVRVRVKVRVRLDRVASRRESRVVRGRGACRADWG